MNLYLDSSALVKDYLLDEPGVEEFLNFRSQANILATSTISRVETFAALAKAVRMGKLEQADARRVRDDFSENWRDLYKLDVNRVLILRASALAWKQNLRGYDAVQLSSALIWKEGLNEEVHFATFDLGLWKAAGSHPLHPLPENLPEIVASWH